MHRDYERGDGCARRPHSNSRETTVTIATQEPPMGETTASAAHTRKRDTTATRTELLRELTAAQSVVERKTTIPILSNFLFEASNEGETGRLTITATDLDQ